ncbi:MAG: hypothetical protein AB7V77_04745 [Candidatus Woesearchaeota archaeon]
MKTEIILITAILATLFIYFSNNEPNKLQCFNYSTEMSTPCCTTENGIMVTAVYVLKSECECPLDTVDYQYDVILNEKEYRTCDCKCEN